MVIATVTVLFHPLIKRSDITEYVITIRTKINLSSNFLFPIFIFTNFNREISILFLFLAALEISSFCSYVASYTKQNFISVSSWIFFPSEIRSFFSLLLGLIFLSFLQSWMGGERGIFLA